MKTITEAQLAAAMLSTVGTVGWMRSTPSDPEQEWTVNAAAIFAALPDTGLDAERMARALCHGVTHQPVTRPCPPHMQMAGNLAAIYARLTEGES